MSIEVKNLIKNFHNTEVLKNITFQIEEEEMTAFLGPSGSGKTTLLRIIAGLEQPSAGEIYIGGERVDHLPPQRRGIGFVFQNYALFKHMTVFDNIAFGLKIRKRKNEIIGCKVFELLEKMALQGLENRYPHQLSGGQQQRVALARALASEPKLLLLDEPFAAVDAKLRKELRQWIVKLHEEMKLTSIFVTHDQQEALEVADRVAVFNQGKLEHFGTPREIYHRPATPFVASFVGDVNYYQTKIKGGYADVGPIQIKAYRLVEGSDVEVVIRPEDVRIEPYHDRADLKAQVKQTTFLGDFFKVEMVLTGDKTITATVSKEQGWVIQPQDWVSLRILSTKLFTKERTPALELFHQRRPVEELAKTADASL
ncbi:ABC transporter ATP-binding protein [Heliorestis acidaminivorans]|uniref:ABC-type quaternary amine transporter n=1 Tax=Heliorestis acidaminivorans TaxID=553427 RepID=A0A6I0EQX1_9FIRM|nr:ABC transporter ATP-binding protein [Heliorestis acidaminivorans]KAB2951827.1 ABC transporter ATP-binding protein [Heliorestis acidaminivorans]